MPDHFAAADHAATIAYLSLLVVDARVLRRCTERSARATPDKRFAHASDRPSRTCFHGRTRLSPRPASGLVMRGTRARTPVGIAGSQQAVSRRRGAHGARGLRRRAVHGLAARDCFIALAATRARLPLSMRWDTLDPRPRGVSTDPPRLDVAYAHARSARLDASPGFGEPESSRPARVWAIAVVRWADDPSGSA